MEDNFEDWLERHVNSKYDNHFKNKSTDFKDGFFKCFNVLKEVIKFYSGSSNFRARTILEKKLKERTSLYLRRIQHLHEEKHASDYTAFIATQRLNEVIKELDTPLNDKTKLERIKNALEYVPDRDGFSPYL